MTSTPSRKNSSNTRLATGPHTGSKSSHGEFDAYKSRLARIGATQIKRPATHVDHSEVGRKVILAQNTGV